MGVRPSSDSVDPWNGLSPWLGDFSDRESMLSMPLSSPCCSRAPPGDGRTAQSGDMGPSSERAGRPSRMSSTVLRLWAWLGGAGCWVAGLAGCGGEWVWPGPGRSRPPGPRQFKVPALSPRPGPASPARLPFPLFSSPSDLTLLWSSPETREIQIF